MQFDDARRIVLDAALSDDGIYIELRLGQDPGSEKRDQLWTALKVLRREYFSHDTIIPRDVSYACALIIGFAQECSSNLKSNGASESLLQSQQSIAQEAFLVFAGELEPWGVDI